VDFSDWSYTNGGIFSGFKTAILERWIAEFDYYSTQGELSRRRVEPIQLWFKSRAWYIKAFCLTRQDVRLFKLTRAANLTVTDEYFAERDLLAIPPNPESVKNQRPDVTLKLKIAPEMAYRVFDEFSEDMVERQPDGGYLATITWPEDDWVYGFLLSFGAHIEVLEPEHMREIVREKAREIAKKYL
jgi:predicted DNA-binding transcriptional regulator YafY